MNKIKKIIGIGLVIAIIIMTMIVVKNKDTLFKQIIKVDFPDGCSEKYINGKLVTPICEEGRQMELDDEVYDYSQLWQNKNITIS